LLRTRRKRSRRRRTTGQHDELAPSQEMPSDEANKLPHHWTMWALCIRSTIFTVTSVQGPGCVKRKKLRSGENDFSYLHRNSPRLRIFLGRGAIWKNI
jgi:hypothetical protein